MSKIKKIITSAMLVMAICVLTIQPAFAAAKNETWYIDHVGNYKASYTLTNNNLTPYKIMGDTANLVVFGDFKKADTGSSNIKLTVQIREYPSGRVLAQTVVNNTNYPNSNMFFITTQVTAGQKIQLFFDASSINNPPGFYRKAWVDYDAYLAPL